MTSRGFATIHAFIAGMLARRGPVRLAGAGRREHDHARPGANALVKIVREITEPYKDVAAAEKAGYGLAFGCVSGPDAGAMGLHYVNMPLVLDGEIDASVPRSFSTSRWATGRCVWSAPTTSVFADAWDKTHSSAPELMGQKFQQFEAPNRFGLPRFYTLHVWAWKDNPTGTFVNWHSNISCDAFSGPTQ